MATKLIQTNTDWSPITSKCSQEYLKGCIYVLQTVIPFGNSEKFCSILKILLTCNLHQTMKCLIMTDGQMGMLSQNANQDSCDRENNASDWLLVLANRCSLTFILLKSLICPLRTEV